MLPFLLWGLSSCSTRDDAELCFVGDSLVAGWDVKSGFPTYMVRNDGVSGARLEDILTWNLDYRNKDVIMLIGTNNLIGDIVNPEFQIRFIADFVEEYRRTIEILAPRRVFVLSVLPRNLEHDPSLLNESIKNLNKALSQMVGSLGYGKFVDVYDDFLYEGKLNMNYSTDGLHLNDMGYNILNARISREL